MSHRNVVAAIGRYRMSISLSSLSVDKRYAFKYWKIEGKPREEARTTAKMGSCNSKTPQMEGSPTADAKEDGESAAAPIRNEEECIDALTQALEVLDPELDVTVHILRLIAEFTPFRTFVSKGLTVHLCWAEAQHASF